MSENKETTATEVWKGNTTPWVENQPLSQASSSTVLGQSQKDIEEWFWKLVGVF